jgi:hypothetical protein
MSKHSTEDVIVSTIEGPIIVERAYSGSMSVDQRAEMLRTDVAWLLCGLHDADALPPFASLDHAIFAV